MPRYIDADALNAAIEKWFDGVCVYDVSPDEAVNDFQSIVDEQPTISPDEVRGVGHWVTEQEAIDANDYSLRDTCSVCGRCDWDCTESASFKYCPNCGARMEVSEDA